MRGIVREGVGVPTSAGGCQPLPFGPSRGLDVFMSNPQPADQYKQKFRPDSDPALEKELEAALGDVSVEQLLGFDKPQDPQEPGRSPGVQPGGSRRGKVVSIGRD